MRRIRPDLDIILDVLRAALEARPDSVFVKSLLRQYMERGGLSRRQLEGLLGKAKRIQNIPETKLATLEAIILRMPLKTKSDIPAPAPLYQKDEETGTVIRDILERYPQHKGLLFLQAKYTNNEPFSAAELADLKRFQKLLK